MSKLENLKVKLENTRIRYTNYRDNVPLEFQFAFRIKEYYKEIDKLKFQIKKLEKC